MQLKPHLQRSLLYLLVFATGLALVCSATSWVPRTPRGPETVPITEIIDRAQRGEVSRVRVHGRDVWAITLREGTPGILRSRLDRRTNLMEILQDRGVRTGPEGVQVSYLAPAGGRRLASAALGFLPLLLLGGLLLFALNPSRQGSSSILRVLRSRARTAVQHGAPATFQDVAGADEAKQELQEVVDFLRHPARFAQIGARMPRGVLMAGPPGTGKTLLARAVAGEAGVPFLHTSGSEFVEMFVGVGAARVRDLFQQAQDKAPCIVFIDEIDAVGRHRGAGLGGGHDEREQTLNQVLVEMDGFEPSHAVIVIAATNRPDILDPALLRPGRFDRRVTLDLPDTRGREDILRVHTRDKPMGPDVSLPTLARETPGFSGADLANLVNEAALMAARERRTAISAPDLEEAVERVTAGPERRSRRNAHREREMTAYHEAGHVIAAWALPHADPPHRATITPRGNSGGHTTMLPQDDRHLWTRDQFRDMMAAMLAGRAAEEMAFGEVTTGAGDDIEKATRVAMNMVKQYAMSGDLGHRTFGKHPNPVFLGRELNEERDYGEHAAREIDREVQRLIHEAHRRARETLEEHRDRLARVARHLLVHGTASGETLGALLETP